MWIVKIEANANGSHDDHRADHITFPPDGWAMIPEGFSLPASYPFCEIEAEEMTYTREEEVYRPVTKTREVEGFDMEGKPVTIPEEYTEMELVTETVEYTMMTVTAMTEGTMPEPAPETDVISDSEALRIITGGEA